MSKQNLNQHYDEQVVNKEGCSLGMDFIFSGSGQWLQGN